MFHPKHVPENDDRDLNACLHYGTRCSAVLNRHFTQGMQTLGPITAVRCKESPVEQQLRHMNATLEGA